jgi:ATP-binding cassette subfamily B protein RaxB
MGYRALIGGLGTLSAGQRQRAARSALYRRLSILFVDEGTANLDVELGEADQPDAADLPITRIHVAHRLETIRRRSRHPSRAVTELTAELRLQAAE